MNPIAEIHKIAHHIPTKALMDIDNRIRDWLASGGKVDDPYIHQQLRYAEKFVGIK
jgi:hypothetical protein